MCNEREALLNRYRSLVFEHAQRASYFSAIAANDPAEANHHLDAALVELDISRQAVHDARERLKQHTVEHGCDGLPESME